MDYKQILIYSALFIIGLVIGKTVKLNISSHGSCSTAQAYLSQIKRMYSSSESSDSYLE